MDELCPETRVDVVPNWRNVWLAGQVLVELGREQAERMKIGEKLVQRVRMALTTLVTADPAGIGAELEPREWANAGNILSRLGDERDFGIMISIPAGEFIMGSSNADLDLERDKSVFRGDR